MQAACIYDEVPLCASQFTGKERDSETGLDYFKARCHASTMGRFMSPETGNISGFLYSDDPQSWNGYAYARNNPVTYTDPNGELYKVCDENGKNCSEQSDKEFEQNKKNAQQNGEIWKNGKIYMPDGNGGMEQKGSYVQTDVDVENGEQIFQNNRNLWAQSYNVGKAAMIGTGVIVGAGMGYAGVEAAHDSYILAQTAHGAMRLLDPTRLGMIGSITTTVFKTVQYATSNGGQAFIRSLGNGNFNVVVRNAAGQIMTTYSNINAQALENLARNYGFK